MIGNMCAQDMPVGFASYFLGNRFILDHNKHLEGVTVVYGGFQLCGVMIFDRCVIRLMVTMEGFIMIVICFKFKRG